MTMVWFFYIMGTWVTPSFLKDIDLSGNIIFKSRDLVLSYIHIGLHTGDAKYSI